MANTAWFYSKRERPDEIWETLEKLETVEEVAEYLKHIPSWCGIWTLKTDIDGYWEVTRRYYNPEKDQIAYHTETLDQLPRVADPEPEDLGDEEVDIVDPDDED